MGELDGKVCLVTGATRGIGRAIAERLAAEGAVVGAGGRQAVQVEAVAAELAGGRGIPLVGDVADPAVPAKLVQQLLDATGRVDVLVNNAGVARDRFLTRVTDDDWDVSLAINLSAPFRFLRAVIPSMKQSRSGVVINVISWAGLRGSPGQAAYSASKAGLLGLTKVAAKELAAFGIRVNALAPSAYTDMAAGMTDERRAQVESMVPMGRIGDFGPNVEGALFLASDRSSFTTGQVLNVDGGLHLV